MTTPYTADPSTASLTINNVTGADIPGSVLFGGLYENCADLAACALVEQHVYTGGVATWNKPAKAAWIEILCVGRGGAGGNGSSGNYGGGFNGGSGGGGGSSGEVVRQVFRATDVPASLSVDVASADTSASNGSFVVFASRGAAGSDAALGDSGSGGTGAFSDAAGGLGNTTSSTIGGPGKGAANRASGGK